MPLRMPLVDNKQGPLKCLTGLSLVPMTKLNVQLGSPAQLKKNQTHLLPYKQGMAEPDDREHGWSSVWIMSRLDFLLNLSSRRPAYKASAKTKVYRVS